LLKIVNLFLLSIGLVKFNSPKKIFNVCFIHPYPSETYRLCKVLSIFDREIGAASISLALKQSSFLSGLLDFPAAAVQSAQTSETSPVIYIFPPQRIPTPADAEADNQISARPAGTGYRAKQIPRDRAHNFSLNVITSLNRRRASEWM